MRKDYFPISMCRFWEIQQIICLPTPYWRCTGYELGLLHFHQVFRVSSRPWFVTRQSGRYNHPHKVFYQASLSSAFKSSCRPEMTSPLAFYILYPDVREIIIQERFMKRERDRTHNGSAVNAAKGKNKLINYNLDIGVSK